MNEWFSFTDVTPKHLRICWWEKIKPQSGLILKDRMADPRSSFYEVSRGGASVVVESLEGLCDFFQSSTTTVCRYLKNGISVCGWNVRRLK